MALSTLIFTAVLCCTLFATVILKSTYSDNRSYRVEDSSLLDSNAEGLNSGIEIDSSLANRIESEKQQAEALKDKIVLESQKEEKENKTPKRYVTLIHGTTKRKIKQRSTDYYPAFLDPDITVLSTNTLPTSRFMPTIGNGHLATVVHSDTIHINAVYNGRGVTSHRARIPSTCSIGIGNVSTLIDTAVYSLDVGRGMYIEEYSSPAVRIYLKMYAHQVLNRLLVTEITIINNLPKSVQVNLTENMGPPSDDMNLDYITANGYRTFQGKPKESELNTSKLVEIFGMASLVPGSIEVSSGETVRYLYLTSIDYDSGRANDYIFKGHQEFLNDTLESTHVAAWEQLWSKGRVDMAGNKTISQVNYASLYYILSGIPTFEIGESFVGLSPGDLAHGGRGQDYLGHVFWDQETWMFPPILALHSDKGKELLKTRVRTNKAAREYAFSRGYQGAMFPWESAYTGMNVSPSSACSTYEQHITADIAFAVQQYLMLTNDTHFLLNEGGADLVNDIALFWASRVSYNGFTKLYSINGVMPPDEYHYPVDNSIYTNCIASIALVLPSYALPLINMKPVSVYEEISNHMNIPFDTVNRWHPEYDGYQRGTEVKQADVILMGYPLNLGLAEDVRRNDLEAYEAVTPGGPAMTWGMFAVGWLELNENDKAMELFNRQFQNVVPPFNVWSEEPKGQGAVNFITGMGGYLQSVIYGFGGFRIFEDKLSFDPRLPAGVTSFNVTGLDYLGGSLDFMFRSSSMSVKVTKRASRNLMLVVPYREQNYTLPLGETVTLERKKMLLVPYGN